MELVSVPDPARILEAIYTLDERSGNETSMEHAFLHPNSGHGCRVMASIGASRYLVSGNVLVGKACTCQSIQLGHNLESWQDKYLHETAPLPSLWNRVQSVY